jgi:hypothetical protein
MDKLTKAIQGLDEDIRNHKEQVQAMAHRQINVNLRNKKANVMKDSNAGIRRKELEKEAAEKGEQGRLDDPFVRRETRPTILWNTGKKLQDAKDGKDEVVAAPVVVKEDKEKAAAVKAEKERGEAEVRHITSRHFTAHHITPCHITYWHMHVHAHFYTLILTASSLYFYFCPFLPFTPHPHPTSSTPLPSLCKDEYAHERRVHRRGAQARQAAAGPVPGPLRGSQGRPTREVRDEIG